MPPQCGRWKYPSPTTVGLVHIMHFGEEALRVSPNHSYSFPSAWRMVCLLWDCHENGFSFIVYQETRGHMERRVSQLTVTRATWVRFEGYLLSHLVTNWINTKSIPEMGVTMWYALANGIWPKVMDVSKQTNLRVFLLSSCYFPFTMRMAYLNPRIRRH